MLTILSDGIAYGMLLFILASGLSVTLGLMNFVNLAHGAFAMAGGYVTTLLVQRLGMPFVWTLPLAFLIPAFIGLVAERTLYVHLYGRTHLEQVLFSIGLVYMAVAGVDYVIGSQQQIFQLPAFLQGRFDLGGTSIGRYRAFVIAICGVLVVVLQLLLAFTRFGSQLRAAVDEPQVARGLGINVDAIFAITFAIGSGLAGLGGALGAEVMGLDPSFPLKLMISFLIVVAVGGTSGLIGPFVAALILGVADVAGKYYLPSLGAFVIYVLMVVLLLLRPQGLFARGR